MLRIAIISGLLLAASGCQGELGPLLAASAGLDGRVAGRAPTGTTGPQASTSDAVALAPAEVTRDVPGGPWRLRSRTVAIPASPRALNRAFLLPRAPAGAWLIWTESTFLTPDPFPPDYTYFQPLNEDLSPAPGLIALPPSTECEAFLPTPDGGFYMLAAEADRLLSLQRFDAAGQRVFRTALTDREGDGHGTTMHSGFQEASLATDGTTIAAYFGLYRNHGQAGAAALYGSVDALMELTPEGRLLPERTVEGTCTGALSPLVAAAPGGGFWRLAMAYDPYGALFINPATGFDGVLWPPAGWRKPANAPAGSRAGLLGDFTRIGDRGYATLTTSELASAAGHGDNDLVRPLVLAFDGRGKEVVRTWLGETKLNQGLARSGQLGDNLLVAWGLRLSLDGDTPAPTTMVLLDRKTLAPIAPPVTVPARLNHFSPWTAFPGGGLGWAAAVTSGSPDAPGAIEVHLVQPKP